MLRCDPKDLDRKFITIEAYFAGSDLRIFIVRSPLSATLAVETGTSVSGWAFARLATPTTQGGKVDVKSINDEVSGEWRIRYADIRTPGVLDPDLRHPSQKLPMCYPLHLCRGGNKELLPIDRDVIIVYSLGESARVGEVLATTRRPLPAGATVVAIFFKETGELFDLALSLHRGAPLIRERLNLANRIEMALGSLGVFIPPEICH